jgi:hypothetical protein
MKVQAKKIFPSWEKQAGQAEIFGLGLIFATHTHTHNTVT